MTEEVKDESLVKKLIPHQPKFNLAAPAQGLEPGTYKWYVIGQSVGYGLAILGFMWLVYNVTVWIPYIIRVIVTGALP